MLGVFFISLLSSCSLLQSPVGLRVDEHATRVILENDQSALALALENPSPNPVTAGIRLEWVNEKDESDSSLERSISVPPGRSESTIPFPIPSKTGNEPMWYRLRYHLLTDGGETAGTLSLAHIAAHVFELRAVLGPLARLGDPLHVLVTAVHPVSGKPVAGVALQASLNLDPSPITLHAVSDINGLADLEFQPLQKYDDSELDFEIRGRLGDFLQTVDVSREIDRHIEISIQTDKPIYQPGQVLHIRLLCFDTSHRAAADMPIRLRINDPDDTGVFVTRLVTSRFGVTSADWQIPANSRLGDYEIRVQSDEGDDLHGFNDARQIKISRYELPEFRVTAKPDRLYYLPTQGASVDVFAEYLFGKPVTNAPVRVVRENSRTWDYRSQKWDIEEGEKYEGQTDSTGHCITRLALQDAHEELTGTEHLRFKDLSFTAYVRDPSSGRTEQRRFDIRITREAIHIYLIESPGGWKFVSTSYADGTPAPAQLTVNGIGSGATNRYGVARIDVPGGQNKLQIVADDGRGAQGHFNETVYSYAGHISVHTDKSLYRPGESIRVEVTSDAPLSTAVLQVLSEWRPLVSQWLNLSTKRAAITIPWQADFAHEITIAVIGREYSEGGARTVLFPADRELKLEVRTEKNEYRPGEEATASLQARLPSGVAAHGVFGIAVVDAAVGERARTDQESAGYGGWGWFWRNSGSDGLGGMTRRDLYRLDCSQPFPADLDMLAEVMLASDGYWANLEHSVDYENDLDGAFSHLFDSQFKLLQDALNARFKKDYRYPRNLSDLQQELTEAAVDLDKTRDPWGSPYVIRFVIERDREGFEFTSAGPDKVPGNDDDIEARKITWKYFQQMHDRITTLLNELPSFPQLEQDARKALSMNQIDLDQLRDPWGTPYLIEFSIQDEMADLTFTSAGPDRTFKTKDDFTLDQVSGSYYKDTYARLAALLTQPDVFPANEKEWNRLLRLGKVVLKKDPWGHDPYVSFTRIARYADIQKPQATTSQNPAGSTKIVPVTQWFLVLQVRSAGPDGIAGTKDDFVLARFEQPSTALSGKNSALKQENYQKSSTKGAIAGLVMDQSGGVIPGASIRAICTKGTNVDFVYEVVTGEDGRYALSLLPPGIYDVGAQVPGFKIALIREVRVVAAKSTVVDITLLVGGAMETVTVMAAPTVLQTTAATLTGGAGPAQSTPRLREYFPETLLWQPSVEAGQDGRAELKFKLADNITTWKVDVIGSTENGEIGTTTTEVKAFQPFFVDHNPPRVLTQGDEIQLPVTIRNYLDQALDADIAMKPENWFQLLGPGEQKLPLAAGTSANAVFHLKAVAALPEARQRGRAP